MDDKIRKIKAQFMAYRNGIVADTLRSAGMTCYNVIFGLNVPQLAHIAGTIEPDMALARKLWADRGVRESRLLAAYLFPVAEVGFDEAEALINDAQTQEEADMLVFRLLRRLPCFAELKESCGGYGAVAMSRY